MRSSSVTIGVFAFWLLACFGGASREENRAGEETRVDAAVAPTEEDEPDDGRCDWTGAPFASTGVERAFILTLSAEADCQFNPTPTRKQLWSLQPGATAAVAVADLSALTDIRMLDTAAGLLVMGQQRGAERVYLVDPDSQTTLAKARLETRLTANRPSASRRLVSATDPLRGLHLLDPATLETDALPCQPCVAAWAHRQDRLVTASFDAEGAILRAWDLDDAVAPGAPLPEPAWTTRVADVEASAAPDGVAVDPFDASATVSIVDPASGEPQLLVVDVATGAVRRSSRIQGPVVFTPDGGQIVGWDSGDGSNVIRTLDVRTLAATDVPVVAALPVVHSSRDSLHALVASALVETPMVVVDLRAGTAVTLDEHLTHLHGFTARFTHDELWLPQDGLWRIRVPQGGSEAVELGWTPNNVLWLPQSDLLFLDDAASPTMALYNPRTEAVVTRRSLNPATRAPLVLKD